MWYDFPDWEEKDRSKWKNPWKVFTKEIQFFFKKKYLCMVLNNGWSASAGTEVSITNFSFGP